MNNEFDDLDELERELGDTVRASLRRVATTVADDQRPMGTGHGSSADDVFVSVNLENTTERRRPRNGVHLIAAGILAAAAAAVTVIALAVTTDGDATPDDAPNQTLAEALAPPPVPLTEHVLTDVDSVEDAQRASGMGRRRIRSRHRDGRHQWGVHLR